MSLTLLLIYVWSARVYQATVHKFARFTLFSFAYSKYNGRANKRQECGAVTAHLFAFEIISMSLINSEHFIR